jgi:hypothetical protein
MPLEELLFARHMVKANQGGLHLLAVTEFEAQDLVNEGERELLREQFVNHIGIVNNTGFFRFLEGFQ